MWIATVLWKKMFPYFMIHTPHVIKSNSPINVAMCVLRAPSRSRTKNIDRRIRLNDIRCFPEMWNTYFFLQIQKSRNDRNPSSQKSTIFDKIEIQKSTYSENPEIYKAEVSTIEKSTMQWLVNCKKGKHFFHRGGQKRLVLWWLVTKNSNQERHFSDGHVFGVHWFPHAVLVRCAADFIDVQWFPHALLVGGGSYRRRWSDTLRWGHYGC